MGSYFSSDCPTPRSHRPRVEVSMATDEVSESTRTLPAEAAKPRPTRVRFVVLGSACALAIITYIHRAGFGANATEMLRDLGMASSELGYATAAFMIAYGLFEVPWGRLGDRFGGRG